MVTTRRRTIFMWVLGAVVLLGVLAVAAAIWVPHWLQQKRVDAYTEAVHQTNVAFAKIHEVQEEQHRVTVLFGFQTEEAEELQQRIADLSELSDDYFSLDSRAGLTAASADLRAELNELTLNDTEQALVEAASELIELHGYMWQTDFLNLEATAVEDLVESPEVERVDVVSDEDVTSEILDEALAIREQTEVKLSAVEQELSGAHDRAEALKRATEASLVPLSAAAAEAPNQAEVVHGMYPGADPGVIEQLHSSAAHAATSVEAKYFTADEEGVNIPIVEEPAEEQVAYEVSDAWRSALIAAQLKMYAEAITAAWITDAGSIEEAVGFNPFLPFG